MAVRRSAHSTVTLRAVVSGKDIAKARRARGLSQTKFGKLVGFDRGTISHIEREVVKDSKARDDVIEELAPELSRIAADAAEETITAGEPGVDLVMLSDPELLAQAQWFLAELAKRLSQQGSRSVAPEPPRKSGRVQSGPLDAADRPSTDNAQ